MYKILQQYQQYNKVVKDIESTITYLQRSFIKITQTTQQRHIMQNMQITQIPINEKITVKYNKIVRSPYDRDIIPGVYEGGYKVWECTLDLLKFMAGKQKAEFPNLIQQEDKSTEFKLDFNGKTVMDVGCGHGLLGITAIKLGATSCIFQDYNKQVLDSITQQNAVINDIPSKKYSFISGDWDNLPEPDQKQEQEQKVKIGKSPKLYKVDIILGSELTYKQENYEKIIRLCKRYLKDKNSMAILANKCYYFGVGGSLDQFQEAVDKNNMSYQSLIKITPPKGGNKKEIICVKLNQESLKIQEKIIEQ